MRRLILILFLFFANSTHSQSYGELGLIAGKLEFQKIAKLGCGVGAEFWAGIVVKFSEAVKPRLDATTPNSLERRNLIDELKRAEETLSDDDYIRMRNIKRDLISKVETTDYYERELEIQKIDSYIQVLELTRRVAFPTLLLNLGKTQITYQRLIETECLSIVNRVK